MRNARSGAMAVAASALLYLLLIQPNHPGAMTVGALLVFPLELPALAILLLLARGSASWALRATVTVGLTGMAVLKLADIAGFVAYLRPFNPALDMALIPAAWRMLSGAVGVPLALGAALALLVLAALTGIAAWWATGCIARLEPPPRRRALGLLLVPAALLVALDAAREVSPLDPPGAAFTARLTYEHLRDAHAARGDLARFREDATRDPFATPPPEQLLTHLRGTDVFVIFVESYGRSALDNPRYGPTIAATLESARARLAAQGLAMRSAYLTAPMVGGQSWLAHGSLLSGLRIDTDARYRALIESPRKSLPRLAATAGWETVAVVPAITLAWPEAAYFGYDRILAAADLGYRGQPFNWVTMPDQFTLAAFERQALEPAPRLPVFAEIALISSHAPWTPIPPLLAWEALGDGHIFDSFALAGDAPGVVWRDTDRVRDQYRRALDYSLAAVFAFAERRAATAPLIVVLGDHQPAAFVSEDPVGRDVPIHIIGAPEALARLDAWGWTTGLVPAAAAPVWPMEAFRDRFLAAFGPSPE